ncbi:hypothetical protein [Glutamicibacter arilaitensis]|uniref:hypothetical protein n=1 Tax=Glutamicibacter arilaitensis TaxID=256701 RepID=UPI003F902D44
MNRNRIRLGALSLLSASALLLASCTAGDQPAPSSDGSTQGTAAASQPADDSMEPTPAPSSAPEPTASASANAKPAELSKVQQIHGIEFKTPQGWSAAGEDCEGECTEWDEWEIKDADGKHVLTLIPTTATSPDGDMSLYQRELLERTELPDPGAGTGFHPTSFIAEFWESTSQEDGEKDSGFDIALADDQMLEQRNENPDLNFFKVGQQSPMMWVEEDYMEDYGVEDDPTQEQAQQFMDSSQYALVRGILLSVKPAS